MVLEVRGRHLTKDIWKPGERCQVEASYRCENCRGRGDETIVQVAEGDLFPMCSSCGDWDMGWRSVPSGRA